MWLNLPGFESFLIAQRRLISCGDAVSPTSAKHATVEGIRDAIAEKAAMTRMGDAWVGQTVGRYQFSNHRIKPSRKGAGRSETKQML